MADKLDMYTIGTAAWFPDAEQGYVSGTLVNKQVTSTLVKMTFNIEEQNRVIKLD